LEQAVKEVEDVQAQFFALQVIFFDIVTERIDDFVSVTLDPVKYPSL
jgi:hypothetical protein